VSESWLHLTVRTSAAHIDALSNFLIERGAPGVVVKRSGLEAYFPRRRGVAALKTSVERYLRDLENLTERTTMSVAQWKIVGEENWHVSWRRFIKSRRVGKSFWVTPPWRTAPKFRRRKIITIEPGLAFGTGTHATTRGCMEFIEQVVASLNGRGFTALDVGTGAGILAIALVKLGAKVVWAIDNDPVAIKVARENLGVNKAVDNVYLSTVDLRSLRKAFPVVVANLTAETILELDDALKKRVARRGWLILSGIMTKKAAAVVDRFRSSFRVVRQKRSREWTTLLLQKK
jgi:ribosomal protein L11 methyltransferase